MLLKAFLLTVSPKDDVSEATIKKLTKYITNNYEYYYGVIERDSKGVRHAHIAFADDKGHEIQMLHDNIWRRFVKPHHGNSIGKYAVVVTVQYIHDWYDTYLRMQDDVEVILDNYDREKVTEMFPTPEQQEKLQYRKGVQVTDPYLNQLASKFLEDWKDHTLVGANEYLQHRMRVLQNMQPIIGERRRRELAKCVYWVAKGIDFQRSPM